MRRHLKGKLAAGVAAGVAVAGGGAAIAATQLATPKEESQAVVNDAAKQLGVKPSELSAAIEKALENRIDAAVAAGRMTKAQADELKARLRAGDFPLFGPGVYRGGGHGHGFGPGGHLEDAASYLGLGEAALLEQLQSGKTLAQVAKDRGKSVDGLVDALVASERKELDAAVAAGRLTEARKEELLQNLETRIRAMVNGQRPERGFGMRGFGMPGFGPPDDMPRHEDRWS